MTNGANGSERSVELRLWAAAQLNLPDHALADQARTAFWRQLRDEWEFMPPPEWQDIAAEFAGPSPSPRPECKIGDEAIQAEQNAMRAKIEEFAQEFFLLPCEARKLRWRTLMNRSVHVPHLVGRLSGLALGLAVQRPKPGSLGPRAQQLAEHILQSFVRRPAQLAQARQEFVAASACEASAWQDAATEVARWCPDIVNLERPLIDDLCSWQSRQASQKQTLEKPSRQRWKRFWASAKDRKPSSNGIFVFVMIMLAIGRLGSMATSSRSTSSPGSNAPRPFTTEDLSRAAESMKFSEWAKQQAEIAKQSGEKPPEGSENDFVDIVLGRKELVRARWEKWHAERAARASTPPVEPSTEGTAGEPPQQAPLPEVRSAP